MPTGRAIGFTAAVITVPDGLNARPLQPDDAAAVVAVITAQEVADVGEAMIELADIVGDWSLPSFSVAESTVGVFDGDLLVAYGEVGGSGRCDAAVHPDVRGRGLGTAIARWMQDNARSRSITEIGMPVPQGSPGDHLLEALGYRTRWESWALELPAGATVPERPLPEGYVVRAAEEAELEQVWTLQEDAFLEWSARERDSFEDWRAQVLGRPGFEPWHLRVAVGPDDRVAAMAWLQLTEDTTYVARLATRKDQRGQGLAQALLVDAFEVGRRHGSSRSELSTDSRTGALTLYEKVGMVVSSTWVNRGLVL